MVPVLFQMDVPLPWGGTASVGIYTFGAMLALAFLGSGGVVRNQLEMRGLDGALASSIVVWAAVGGVIGSRVLSLANDWGNFL